MSDLIQAGSGLNNFSDADGGQPGIAITGVNTAKGSLYFSTNNGTTWTSIPSASVTSARLLQADAETWLYFRPSGNVAEDIGDAVTFKAWDRTGGYTNGQAGVDTLASMTFFGRTRTSGEAYDVAVKGQYVFIAGASGGLVVVDASNPALPVEKSTLSVGASAEVITIVGNIDPAL